MTDAPARRHGRPGRWHPAVPGEVRAHGWMNGATVPEICAALGVSPAVHYAWMRQHPAYAAAVQEVRARHADLVEAALVKRALGYEYTATEEHVSEDEALGRDGEVVTLSKRRRVTKPVHVPPDVSAQRFFLINRAREEWAERAEVKVTTPYAELVEEAFRRLQEHDGRMIDVTPADEGGA